MLKDPTKHFVNTDEEAYAKMISDPTAILFGTILPWESDSRLYENREMVEQLVTFAAYGYPKKSEFREVLDYHLLKIQQSGMIELEWSID